MTVVTTLAKAGPYTADGEQTSFPFGFRVLNAEHVAVWVDGRRFPDSYTVELTDEGGTVIFMEAPPKDSTVVFLRDVPITQETDLQNNTAFLPEVIEDELDKIVMVQQQFAEELERCAKVPVGSDENPVDYLQNIKSVTINAKDVALNAADSAANSALTASISERNIGLIWAEITGDSSLADNALLTIKEAAEATGAIRTAKEIAIGEINGVGSMAIASTQKAAEDAMEAAKAATDSAGAITGKVDDAITIQVSQAVGADGVLGVAVAAGIADVESARQQALDKANATLEQIRTGSTDFENAKNQGIVEISNKVAGVALDVETALARAQIIADNYLADAKATVSGSLADLEKMKEEATAAGNSKLLEYINKRIEELNTLQGYLTDAESAASAAAQFKQQTQGIVDGFTVTVDGALAAVDNRKQSALDALAGARDSAVSTINGRVSEATTQANNALNQAQAAATSATNAGNSASSASTSASNALKSAQDAAASASDANASALAAGSAAQSAANASITAHNSSSTAHSALFNGLIKNPVWIPSNSDLNDYKAPGFYRAYGDASAASILNSPTSKSFYLQVVQVSADSAWGMAMQVLFPYGGAESMYIRSFYQNTWTEWKRLASTADLGNYLPLAGGKMKGASAVIAKADNTGDLSLTGGAYWGDGATITLMGSGAATNPGKIAIYAKNSSNTTTLSLDPDGTLTWGGKDITLGYPNYAAGVEVTTKEEVNAGYAAPFDGWVSCRSDNGGDVYINDTFMGDSDTYCAHFLPVKTGDVVKVTASLRPSLVFFPIK